MTPESVIQADILRTFGRLPNMRLWRQNTGVGIPPAAISTLIGDVVSPATASRLPRIKFSIPGAADLTGILPDGKRLEIEVKTARGRQSVQQINFHKMITSMRGLYILARSVDDVWAGLADAGYELKALASE